MNHPKMLVSAQHNNIRIPLLRERNADKANLQFEVRSPRRFQGEVKEGRIIAREECSRIVSKYSADQRHTQPEIHAPAQTSQNRKINLQSAEVMHRHAGFNTPIQNKKEKVLKTLKHQKLFSVPTATAFTALPVRAF